MASTDADKANTGIKTDDNVAYTTVKRRAKSSVKHRKVQPITKSLNDLVEEKRLLLTKSGYADACKRAGEACRNPLSKADPFHQPTKLICD